MKICMSFCAKLDSYSRVTRQIFIGANNVQSRRSETRNMHFVRYSLFP